MIVSVLGDTFADVVCRPLENLPEWGKVRDEESLRRIVSAGCAATTSVTSAVPIVLCWILYRVLQIDKGRRMRGTTAGLPLRALDTTLGSHACPRGALVADA